MTADEYIEQLGRLISEGRDQEALDFAACTEPHGRPPLTAQQHDRVGWMLEGPSMMVAMIEATGHEAERELAKPSEEMARPGGRDGDAVMTPDEHLSQLGRLLRAGRDQEALDFAACNEPTVDPPLTAEQMDWVGGMLEMSAMAVAMVKDTAAGEAARTA